MMRLRISRWCVVCGAASDGPLCVSCAGQITPGRSIALTSDVVVTSALAHHGVARTLVHRVKYEGSAVAADVLARKMLAAIPANTSALIPVPRARIRVLRYGVDPSLLLVSRLSALTGVPVTPVLDSGWWWPSHNSGRWSRFNSARFVSRTVAMRGAVLVDDVATTGETLLSAVSALGGGGGRCVVATAPQRLGSRHDIGSRLDGGTADQATVGGN